MTHPKHAEPDHQILDVIRHRWSPRAFDISRPVPLSDLRTVFEAARWAPSSYNEQPWRFIVADRHRDAEAFGRMSETLDSNNRYAILHRLQDAKKPETRARRLAQYIAMLDEGRKLHP